MSGVGEQHGFMESANLENNLTTKSPNTIDMAEDDEWARPLEERRGITELVMLRDSVVMVVALRPRGICF